MRMGCGLVAPLGIELASLGVMRYRGLVVFDVPAVKGFVARVAISRFRSLALFLLQ